MPPPPLVVDDDAGVRRDVCSADVRRVHPDLPLNGTPEDRLWHQRACDARAYALIRARFPDFLPPGESGTASSSTASSSS